MPRFIAEHTLPHSEAEFLEMAKTTTPQIPEGFTWKLTYCDFDSHKFVCEWDAPSKEALDQAFKANQMPYDVIYAVKLYNVADATMND